jgi:hypothetical protein
VCNNNIPVDVITQHDILAKLVGSFRDADTAMA